MADKTSVKLNIGERFGLLGMLPQQGDFVTLKIIRKLRETLAPSDGEAEKYGFVYEYECKVRDDGGKPCGFKVTSPVPPKCPTHGSYMEQTGMMFWKPEMSLVEKEIWFGNKAKSIITEVLTRLNDEKRLSFQQATIYEKFIKQDEEEEE